jgi:hypothetical protein
MGHYANECPSKTSEKKSLEAGSKNAARNGNAKADKDSKDAGPSGKETEKSADAGSTSSSTEVKAEVRTKSKKTH